MFGARIGIELMLAEAMLSFCRGIEAIFAEEAFAATTFVVAEAAAAAATVAAIGDVAAEAFAVIALVTALAAEATGTTAHVPSRGGAYPGAPAAFVIT